MTKNKVISAIKGASNSNQKGDQFLTGFSGLKIIDVLKNLVKGLSDKENLCYLEVGVFQGLTLLSVAREMPEIPCFGIDNFSDVNPENSNLSILNERIRELGITNAILINNDYEDALEKMHDYVGDRKIAVYFIDGPHDYRSQLMCLELVLPYLHKDAVIVIDDCNYQHVRQANRDFLVTHPEYKLVFDAYTACHPQNMSDSQRPQAETGWWNGINIIVRDPKSELDVMYPPTLRSRALFENEHEVHADKMAGFSKEGVRLVRALYEKNLLAFFRMSISLLFSFKKSKSLKERFSALNTFSRDLPTERFNE